MTSAGGPTNMMPACSHAAANAGILGQEAVARVDRVGARRLRRADDGGNRQVALARRRRADAIARPPPRRARAWRRPRSTRPRFDAQLAARRDDPDRNLAAIGDQQAPDHERLRKSEVEVRVCTDSYFRRLRLQSSRSASASRGTPSALPGPRPRRGGRRWPAR